MVMPASKFRQFQTGKAPHRKGLVGSPIYAAFLLTEEDSVAWDVVESHLTDMDEMTGKYCLAFVPFSRVAWAKFVRENRDYWLDNDVREGELRASRPDRLPPSRYTTEVINGLGVPISKLPCLAFFRSPTSTELILCSLADLDHDAIVRYLRTLFDIVRSAGTRAENAGDMEVGLAIWSALKSHRLARWRITRKTVFRALASVGLALISSGRSSV